MRLRRFNLIHSIATISLLAAVEGAITIILDTFFGTSVLGPFVVIITALAGGIVIVLFATEVIREVRNAMHMLALLSAVIMEFIVFFAFQYLYLAIATPHSFEHLILNPINLLLHSTMIFALNPLYLPTSLAGQALLLVNTIEALIIALFVMQNVWQFRKEDNRASSS